MKFRKFKYDPPFKVLSYLGMKRKNVKPIELWKRRWREKLRFSFFPFSVDVYLETSTEKFVKSIALP